MALLLALSILTAAPTIPGQTPGCAGAVVLERTAYVMGTVLRLELGAADRACGLAASEAALAEVRRLETVLSAWRSDSEVGVLNGSPPGHPPQLSPELRALLTEARSWTERTGGAFDPGVGALVDAWDLRGAGRVPTATALATAMASTGLLRTDPHTLARPDSAWWLDTGAFGKGAALRAAGAVLRAHGVTDALLDFGGQLLVLGAARPVAIAHPAHRDSALPRTLRIAGASVSTTSSSERYVDVAGTRYGHVLDPRTGRPVPAWGSVTVLAADAFAADAVSTALFVLGPDAALAWADAHPEFGVLIQVIRGDVIVRRESVGLPSFLNPEPSK